MVLRARANFSRLMALFAIAISPGDPLARITDLIPTDDSLSGHWTLLKLPQNPLASDSLLQASVLATGVYIYTGIVPMVPRVSGGDAASVGCFAGGSADDGGFFGYAGLHRG